MMRIDCLWPPITAYTSTKVNPEYLNGLWPKSLRQFIIDAMAPEFSIQAFNLSSSMIYPYKRRV